jgi:putative colanic acid biosysnthesis UDP-glucose lipid carrier transferase
MSNKNHIPLARKASGITLARDNILSITESLAGPIVAVISLWIVAIIQEGHLDPIYLFLSLIIFFLSYPGDSKLHQPIHKSILSIVSTWVVLASLLILFAYTTRYMYLFSTQTIMLWLFLTPIMQILALLFLRSMTPLIMSLQGPIKQAVIAGLNQQSVELALRLNDTEFQSINVIGYFEDRTLKRIAETTDIDMVLRSNINVSILGKINELAEYIKTHQVSVIYLSLPMSGSARILQLLDDLKDTTASIYFVPDIFMTDLIQGRMGQVDDIPVVAICETPFTGFNGLIKRSADILFSVLILLLILPVLIIIAISVKLNSPGPVIFKQRRYGLDGKEILVYKFRSMSVCEDGGKVTQATKNDQRITKVGAFLRKSSLDELPQFINVLQGRMSVVGPRPHAVSHNEMYRKLIKGYMIRHKVKPGITGWAQVNGLRGETETLDKMKARIDYDLEYLRNWSPKLDIYIVFKTVSVVFKGEKNAY